MPSPMNETDESEDEDALAFRFLSRQFDYPKDIIKKKKKTVSEELLEALDNWIKGARIRQGIIRSELEKEERKEDSDGTHTLSGD